MSLNNADRKLRPGSGNSFRAGNEARLGSAHFAQAISAALRADYGGTHAAVKTIEGITGANGRAAKNWLEAKNCPNGPSLVMLCRHSDRVLEAILRLSGREQILTAKKVIDARQKLREILALLDELEMPS